MPTRTSAVTAEQLKPKINDLFFPGNKNQSVGLELEIWPFRDHGGEGNQLVRFFNDEGTGLIQLLQQLAPKIPGLSWAPTADGAHRFLYEEGGQLTFEPGGQLEYSGPPKHSLAEAIQDITYVIETLRCLLKNHGIWFFHSGLNPWHTIDEVGLQLRKDRYIHMNNYFKAVGPYGQKMMRLSTSLQINLDVGDPETAQRRWLAANLLAPVFTALFANSPFIHRKPTGAYSFRSIIWQHLDPSRTGFQKDFLAADYCPCPREQYLDFALNAYCMLLPDGDGNMVFNGEFVTFETWMRDGYNGFFPQMSDWENHLTTLFPEVRARGFFEIRYLDAQSKVWCAVPGILLTHLLYSEQAREKVIDLLLPYRVDLPRMLATAARRALDDTDIASLAKRIYRLALDTAAPHEQPTVLELCDRFYRQYTAENHTPAGELLRLNDGNLFTAAQYRDFEKAQLANAGDVLDMICEYS